MKPFIVLFLLFSVCHAGFADVPKQEAWHSPIREYAAYDSVLVPLVDFAAVQKVKVGASFEEVKTITGFTPVDYTIHPGYAILETIIDGQYYEVAFLHGKDKKVEAISFRRSPWMGHERANQALQHNDPSCHAPCMRTCRASRGRG